MYSYIQPKSQRDKEWEGIYFLPSHTPYVWALSNEVTLTKKSKFSLEYWEKPSNPETNSDDKD